LAKDIAEFQFADTPINETLVHDLASGNFLAHQRNVVLVGGTGTGKTHLAIAMARALIGDGKRGRFFNVVELLNKLEAEGRSGRRRVYSESAVTIVGGRHTRRRHPPFLPLPETPRVQRFGRTSSGSYPKTTRKPSPRLRACRQKLVAQCFG
jgi:hypothetical protein